MKHTKLDLKQMQSLPLQSKILMTEHRIQEWYDYWNGQVYIAFSGGKDSTVLLHIARQMYPDIEAVFVDTGLEYPEIRQFVKTFDNVTILRPKMRFDEVIKKYGYPIISKEVSQRIHEYRTNPNSKWIKDRWDNAKFGSRFDISKWIPLRDSGIKVSHKCCGVMKKIPRKNMRNKRVKIL